MATLSFAGLTKAFGGPPVLSGVDLEVEAGRLVAILGASGSGKTTLLRLLCGFERGGWRHHRAERPAGLRPRPARSGGAPPHRLRRAGGRAVPASVGRRQHPVRLRRRARHVRGAAEDWLERVGLPASYASRPPHELSGGEQQRVALARALAPAPKLVLLDEPFSALDAALRVETRMAVVAALDSAGATALLVTHDQSEALSMGYRVAVLRQGLLVQVATPQALYRKPVDAELARFVGEAVLLDGMAELGMVTCALGRLAIAAGPSSGPVEVLVRPEQIRLEALDGREPGPGPRGRVCSDIFYGHDASIRLELLGASGLAVTARGFRPCRNGDRPRGGHPCRWRGRHLSTHHSEMRSVRNSLRMRPILSKRGHEACERGTPS